MPKWKRHLSWFFQLSATERRGMVVLLTITLLVLFFSLFYNQIFNIRKLVFNPENFKDQIQTFETSLISDTINQQDFNFLEPTKSVKAASLKPFPFDPNTMEVADWQKLGLTEKQIKSILNYRAKGGVFRKKEDFARLYTISDAEYTVLEPYIQINIQKKNYPVYEKKNRIISPVEINSADSLELLALPGMGPYMAQRIIRYREKLGGFYDIHQLMEIKGLDSLRFQRFSAYLLVDASKIKKFSINDSDYYALRRHPYLGHQLAYSIVSTRKKSGKLKFKEDLKRLNGINDSIFARIIPYIIIK